MKKKVQLLLFFGVLMMMVLGTNCYSYATIASGTSGTCSWEISDSGVLEISPTNGVSGTLDSFGAFDDDVIAPPWSEYTDSIVSVKINYLNLYNFRATEINPDF